MNRKKPPRTIYQVKGFSFLCESSLADDCAEYKSNAEQQMMCKQ